MQAAQSRLRIAEGMKLSYYGPPSVLKGQQCYLKLFPVGASDMEILSVAPSEIQPLNHSNTIPVTFPFSNSQQRFEFRHARELLALNTKMFALS